MQQAALEGIFGVAFEYSSHQDFWEALSVYVEAIRLADGYPPSEVAGVLRQADRDRLLGRMTTGNMRSKAVNAAAFQLIRFLADDSPVGRPRDSTSDWLLLQPGVVADSSLDNLGPSQEQRGRGGKSIHVGTTLTSVPVVRIGYSAHILNIGGE